MKKILIDFDNTIANSCETIINIKTGIPVDEVIPRQVGWDFTPYANTPEERKKSFVSVFNTQEFWDMIQPLDGFIEWIKKQHKEGIPIYVCSKRFIGQFSNLILWFKRYDIDQYISDYILIHKDYSTKSFLLDDETYIIDDNPKCFNNSNIGTRILIGDYGYGHDFEKDGFTYTKRILSWNDMEILK